MCVCVLNNWLGLLLHHLFHSSQNFVAMKQHETTLRIIAQGICPPPYFCVCLFVYVCRWHAVIVDGHSVEELCKALCQPHDQPIAIVAQTYKGKGISGTTHKTLLKDIAFALARNLQA